MSQPSLTTATRVDPALLDALFECYLDWKEACFAVSETYARWREAASGDRRSAFAAYRAALDVEQDASEGYAELLASASEGA